MGERKLRGKLIVLIGLPGSGKSSWAKKYKRLSNNEIVDIISSDEIRIELSDVNDQSRNGEVFNIMKKRTIEGLKQNHTVIYDATNISSKRRKTLLNELKKYYTKAICIFKYKPILYCYEDNALRDKQVPSEVIDKMYKTIDIPSKHEGFDEIIIDYDYKLSLYLENKRKNNIGFKIEKIVNCNSYAEYKYILLQFGLTECIGMPQDSKYHSLSLSKHMYFTYKYIKDVYKGDNNLLIASMLHDIGKVEAKTEDKEERYCHYYGHEHISAYDVIELLSRKVQIEDGDILDIAFLISQHMKLIQVDSSEKLRRFVGDEDYKRIFELNSADTLAK